MGKFKMIAMATKDNLCYYCNKKIRAVGSERKNGRERPTVPDKEERWFHLKCLKDRKAYYGLKNKLTQEKERGLPMYF